MEGGGAGEVELINHSCRNVEHHLMLTVRWREWVGEEGVGKGIINRSIIALFLFNSGCNRKICMSKICIEYIT